ncbi:hypothetical protein IFM89_032314 [Coptis chinensis]|uniref:Uncharacterized protein n=1 Tax=Coptis chinensis TaxID=261450 RepID=A0A835IFK6_9MAGN|nr:hypothetical protein IFM89_032314 [Coptis chinensis]
MNSFQRRQKYDFDAAAPFQTSDIFDLQPVVKHSVPVCSEARDLVETGKVRLVEGMLNKAYTLFSEAFSMLQQVIGPMHREVANCCCYDVPGHWKMNTALRYLQEPLKKNEHLLGEEHIQTAACYHALAIAFNSLKKNDRLLGEEHIQTAACFPTLAIAFSCMGAFKLSLHHEKKTYDILVKQLGEEVQGRGILRTGSRHLRCASFSREDKAHAGLGTGLASLDSKKQKTKSKSALSLSIPPKQYL